MPLVDEASSSARGSNGVPGRYDYSARTELELSDRDLDIGETRNVVDDHPEIVARLEALADAMRADLGANLTE